MNTGAVQAKQAAERRSKKKEGRASEASGRKEIEEKTIATLSVRLLHRFLGLVSEI
jgi:hypothetical protein